MSHLKKNTRGAVPGLAVHFERKTDHHTNKEIDVSKTYLNQDIMADGSDMLSRFNERLNDVYCMKRDDVKTLATMKKATLQSQHETEELKQTLGQVNAQLADIQADYQNLKETHQALQKRQREQQQLDYAMRDMLKNDYGVDKLSHTDVEARSVLYKLDHEELTQNKKEAQSWLKTLTTARADPDTKIALTRLDRGIEQVKGFWCKFSSLT